MLTFSLIAFLDSRFRLNFSFVNVLKMSKK